MECVMVERIVALKVIKGEQNLAVLETPDRKYVFGLRDPRTVPTGVQYILEGLQRSALEGIHGAVIYYPRSNMGEVAVRFIVVPRLYTAVRVQIGIAGYMVNSKLTTVEGNPDEGNGSIRFVFDEVVDFNFKF